MLASSRKAAKATLLLSDAEKLRLQFSVIVDHEIVIFDPVQKLEAMFV